MTSLLIRYLPTLSLVMTSISALLSAVAVAQIIASLNLLPYGYEMVGAIVLGSVAIMAAALLRVAFLGGGCAVMVVREEFFAEPVDGSSPARVAFYKSAACTLLISMLGILSLVEAVSGRALFQNFPSFLEICGNVLKFYSGIISAPFQLFPSIPKHLENFVNLLKPFFLVFLFAGLFVIPAVITCWVLLFFLAGPETAEARKQCQARLDEKGLTAEYTRRWKSCAKPARPGGVNGWFLWLLVTMAVSLSVCVVGPILAISTNLGRAFTLFSLPLVWCGYALAMAVYLSHRLVMRRYAQADCLRAVLSQSIGTGSGRPSACLHPHLTVPAARASIGTFLLLAVAVFVVAVVTDQEYWKYRRNTEPILAVPIEK